MRCPLRPPASPVGRVPGGPRPSDMPESAGPSQGPKLGVRTLPVSDEAQRQNNLPNAQGALVVAVAVNSPAEAAKIPLGAVITALDDQPINSPQELTAAVRTAGSRDLQITYIFRGQEAHTRVALRAPGESPPLELRGRPTAPAAAAERSPGQAEL